MTARLTDEPPGKIWRLTGPNSAATPGGSPAPTCPTGRYRGRILHCEGGDHHGSHIALVDGEPVFWGPGLRRAL